MVVGLPIEFLNILNNINNMTYKQFVDILEELQLDLDSAAEALDIEVSEIESWENEDEIPRSAVKWIKSEKVELSELNNTNEDENFINDLALLTQITKKSTELNFNHGFLLHEYLKKYLSNSNEKKIYIVEIGTARGFSSIVMSYLLSKYDIEYEIHTIDILPHKTKMYWNCISDPINGKVSREELLIDYKKYVKNKKEF